MIGIRNDKKIIPGLQGSEKITTAYDYVELYPLWQNIIEDIYSKYQNVQFNKIILNLNTMKRRLLIIAVLNSSNYKSLESL